MLPLVGVVAMLAAACSGAATTSGVASLEADQTTAPANDDIASAEGADEDIEGALLAFAECMREHGIDMEDPTVDADGNVQFGRFGGGQGQPGEEGFDRDAVRAARETCGDHLENATLGFRGGGNEDFQDTLLEFAQCMRDNGYDMDDPDFSGGDGGGPGGGPLGQLDRDAPAFQEAQETCADILGGQGLRGPGGPGSGGGSGG
jgi:hypothetical protein